MGCQKLRVNVAPNILRPGNMRLEKTAVEKSKKLLEGMKPWGCALE
jgi:hypothetical protein